MTQPHTCLLSLGLEAADGVRQEPGAPTRRAPAPSCFYLDAQSSLSSFLTSVHGIP